MSFEVDRAEGEPAGRQSQRSQQQSRHPEIRLLMAIRHLTGGNLA
jgi:hypothetical protein